MHQRLAQLKFAALVVLWLALISGLYFLYHKPFSPEYAIQLARFLWQVLTAIAVISIPAGVGRSVLPVEDEHPVSRAFLQFCLGLGIAATAVFLVGLAGAIRYTLPVITLVALILLRKQILAWWKDFWQFRNVLQSAGRFERSIVWMIAIMLGCGLVVAAAPPFQYDALTYHLALPETYLQNGRIFNLTEMVRSGMPQLGEMIYLWAASLGGLNASAITGWILGPITFIAFLVFLRESFTDRAAVIGCAALAAATSIMAALGWAYIDWFCLVFGLAGMIALKRWSALGDKKSILLAGLIAGFAIASKYTAGVFVAGAFLFILFQSLKAKRKVFETIALYLLGAIVPVLPWLIKNLVATGNPLYPYLSATGAFGAERAAILQSLPPFGNWLDIVLLPVRATTVGLEGAYGYSQSIGPLLLILGVFAWIKTGEQKDNPLLSISAWVGITGIVIWVVANQLNGILIQTRMYYVLFPAFVVLAAAGFRGLATLSVPRLKLDWLISVFTIIVLSFALIQNLTGMIRLDALNYLTGSIKFQDYLSHNLGWYAPAMDKIRSLPAATKTLLLYEPRGLYCSPACQPDELLDRWSSSLRTHNGDPNAVLQDWKQQGFGYLLLNKAGLDFLKSENDPHHPIQDLVLLENTLNRLPIVEDYGGSYQLYELK